MQPPATPLRLDLMADGRVLRSISLDAHFAEECLVTPFVISRERDGATGPMDLRVAGTGEVVWRDRPRDADPAGWDTGAARVLGRRVCVVAAHPDDECLTFGGAILRHRLHGDTVRAVILTDGAWQMQQEDSIGQRLAECERAAAQLGIGMPDIFGYPDGKLAAFETVCAARLEEWLAREQPELVYTHHPLDRHDDHEACARIVCAAADRCSAVGALAFGEFYRLIEPNLLLDISDVAERKYAAAREYASQIRVHPYDQIAEALNIYRSLPVSDRVRHSEGYVVLSRPAEHGFLEAFQDHAAAQSGGLRGLPRSGSFGGEFLRMLSTRTGGGTQHEGIENAVLSEDELPEIDISIVSYQSGDAVLPFFKSLLRSGYPLGKLRIFVCDHSPDGMSYEALEAAKTKWANTFGAFEIRRRRNAGFARGQNFNIERGISPFVLVTNIDLEIQPGALLRLVRRAIVDLPCVAAWEFRQVPFEHPKVYDPVSLAAEWISGACMLLRRDAIRKVGAFDPRFFLYCEDTDLSYRLRRAGWVLRFCPDCEVIHHADANEENRVRPSHRHLHYSNFLLRLRYGTRHDIREGFRALRMGWAVAKRFDLSMNDHLREQGSLLLRSLAVWFGRRRYRMPARASVLRLFEGESQYSAVKQLPKPEVAVQRSGPPRFPRRFKMHSFGFERKGATFRVVPSPEPAPSVSIVVRTTGRRNGLLREALHSLQNQTHTDLQIVVVEDGGDRALPVVREMASRSAKKWTHIPLTACGRAGAGNAGLAAASGGYVGFLDDDDVLFADHVAVLAGELHRRPEAVAVYARALEVSTRVACQETPVFKEAGPRHMRASRFSQLDLLHHNLFAIQSVLFRKSLYERAGGFDLRLEQLEDWDLWIRFSQLGHFHFVDKTTSAFRVPATLEALDRRQALMDKAYQKVWAKHHTQPVLPVF